MYLYVLCLPAVLFLIQTLLWPKKLINPNDFLDWNNGFLVVAPRFPLTCPTYFYE
ncbi:hypothetical protein RICGR_0326 [Rickettsiella grylli]|uniref:Uncharacterized protein n=1 Tax=Rickettsiella grylli TaxID=59196 RepID=A8PK71_9COXI|nr:hypothetical protein RICGR_0326 [Rickettsiella grylli]